ncbi:MAG: sorbosone dehydrogenase family protein [Armatimonadota bacterium]
MFAIVGVVQTKRGGRADSTLASTSRTQTDPRRLPQPYRSSSVDAGPQYLRGRGDAPLKVPTGFVAEPFARGFQSPRWMAVAPNGDVFVTESYQGRIRVLRDANRDGRAESRFLFAAGLRLPHGLAFHKGWLYVGNTDSVVRFPYRTGQTKATGSPQMIISGIPAMGRKQHWTRNIVFDPDGEHFYLTVGSASNKAVESPPRATITRYRADGSGRQTFATGLRNPVGIGFRPGTNEMWTTCVERDFMGDDLVPDFLTKVRQGDFFGWPWYYIGRHLDPRAPQGAPKGKVAVPDVLFTAHSVPLGMLFYTGSNFPASYQGDAFVAMRGSTNRRISSGFRVVRVPFEKGRPVGGYEDFVTGWLSDPRKHLVYGRPVGLAQWTDGSLLVSDEAGHMIWRVRYRGPTSRNN